MTHQEDVELYDVVITNNEKWIVISTYETMMICMDRVYNIKEIYNDRGFEVVGNIYDEITKKQEYKIKKELFKHLAKVDKTSEVGAEALHNLLILQEKIPPFKYDGFVYIGVYM